MSTNSPKLSGLLAVFKSNFIRGSLNDDERLSFLRHVIENSRGWELETIESWLATFLKRDFLACLPCEIAWKIVDHLDGQTAAKCLRVSQKWYEVISSCPSIWLKECAHFGINMERLISYKGGSSGSVRWREIFQKHHQNIQSLCASSLQPTWCLCGHKTRITVLCCHGNTLVSGMNSTLLHDMTQTKYALLVN
jgi:hypothetical protein